MNTKIFTDEEWQWMEPEPPRGGPEGEWFSELTKQPLEVHRVQKYLNKNDYLRIDNN